MLDNFSILFIEWSDLRRWSVLRITYVFYFIFFRLITHSDCLKEIDLEHNLIGDLGGRELLEALMDRKEGLN